MPPLPDFVRLRLVYTVPGMDRVRVERDRVYREAAGSRLEMDVYRPADATPGASRPVVILIHGGPVPPGASAKNMGVFLSYGEMLAAAHVTVSVRRPRGQDILAACGQLHLRDATGGASGSRASAR